MRARFFLLIALAALSACLAPARAIDGPPTIAEIRAIESAVRLPEGARPLSDYGRFYAADGGVIRVEYLAGRLTPFVLEHVHVLARPAPDIVIVALEDLPGVDDGGCGIINFTYDRASRRIIDPPVCNGIA